MSFCSDERYSKMIYAWELNLLTDEDHREMDMHLLECDHCYEQILRFREEVHLLKSDSDMKDLVNRVVSELDKDDKPATDHDTATGRYRPKQRMGMRTLLAAAAILVILLLRPWRLEFSPDQDAVAAGNRLAVMDFETGENDEDLGKMLARLMTTDLSESQYLGVVSSERVADIVRQIDDADIELGNKELAEAVAARADVRWVIGGTAVREPHGLKVSLQIIDTESHRLDAPELIDSSSTESVFSIVDKLSTIVKGNLQLPLAAMEEPDREVAEITTRSHKAYSHYLRGLDFWSKLYATEARSSFEMAIAFDSTFAMAYYYLAMISDPTLVTLAVKYSDGSTQREQAYIRSLEAAMTGDTARYARELQAITRHYPDDKTALYDLARHKQSLGDVSEAIRLTQEAIALDTLFKKAYNQLVYLYNQTEDFERAILTANTYVSIAPNEANPYDTRGELYALNGNLKLAIESYNTALQIKPDFPGAVLKLGCLYVFNKEYDLARALYTRSRSTTNDPEYFRERIDLAHILVHQGKLDQAVGLLDSALQQAAEMDTTSLEMKEWKADIHARLAKILEETDPGRAFSHAESAIELIDQVYPEQRMIRRPVLARLMAALGDFEGAECVAQDVKLYVEANDINLSPHWFTTGTVAFYKGDYKTAVDNLEKAVTSNSPYKGFEDYYLLARGYQELGRLTDAIAMFEKLMAHYTPDRLEEGIWNVKMHYYLGLAYENNKQPDKAIEQYQEFLDTWQAADSSLTEVPDAKNRLARLLQQI